MCGLSRAGKSTKAKEIALETGAEIVALDDEIFNRRFEMDFWKVQPIAIEKVRNILLDGKSVIYDSMALTIRERKEILDKCRIPKIRIICIFMDTTIEIIKKRRGCLSESDIQPPSIDEGFDEIWIYKQ